MDAEHRNYDINKIAKSVGRIQGTLNDCAKLLEDELMERDHIIYSSEDGLWIEVKHPLWDPADPVMNRHLPVGIGKKRKLTIRPLSDIGMYGHPTIRMHILGEHGIKVVDLTKCADDIVTAKWKKKKEEWKAAEVMIDLSEILDAEAETQSLSEESTVDLTESTKTFSQWGKRKQVEDIVNGLKEEDIVD